MSNLLQTALEKHTETRFRSGIQQVCREHWHSSTWARLSGLTVTCNEGCHATYKIASVTCSDVSQGSGWILECLHTSTDLQRQKGVSLISTRGREVLSHEGRKRSGVFIIAPSFSSLSSRALFLGPFAYLCLFVCPDLAQ